MEMSHGQKDIKATKKKKKEKECSVLPHDLIGARVRAWT